MTRNWVGKCYVQGPTHQRKRGVCKASGAHSVREPVYYLIVVSFVASISHASVSAGVFDGSWTNNFLEWWFSFSMLKDFRTELFISGRFLDSISILFFGYIKMTPAKHKSYNLTTYLVSRR